jgi:hypothetical protein
MVVFMPSDEIREKYKFLGHNFVPNFFFVTIFWCSWTNENVHILNAYSFSLGFWKTLLFTNLSWLFTSCWCFTCFLKDQMRLNSSQGIICGNIIPSHPSTHLKDKKKFIFKQWIFVIVNLGATSWFYTVFNFDSLWVNFVKWLGLSKH